jgi:hypothetical protein
MTDDLRQLAEAATPGPWMHYRDRLRPQFSTRINEVQAGGERAVIAWSGFDDSSRPEKQHAANAAYITACSPDRILALLDTRDAVREALNRAEQRELEALAALAAAESRCRALEEALRDTIRQVGTRYDDQWATGPVYLADLDAARALLTPPLEEEAPE